MNFDYSHLDGRTRAQGIANAKRGEGRVDEFRPLNRRRFPYHVLEDDSNTAFVLVID